MGINYCPSQDWDRYADEQDKQAEAMQWGEAVEQTSQGQRALNAAKRLQAYAKTRRQFDSGREATFLTLDARALADLQTIVEELTGDYPPPYEPEPEWNDTVDPGQLKSFDDPATPTSDDAPGRGELKTHHCQNPDRW